MKNDATDVFGEPISVYTRHQAIEDGVLVDLTAGDVAEVTRQHYRYPVAVTTSVWDIIDKAVKNPRWANDYKGVVHDLLWMSRNYCKVVNETTRLFQVTIRGAGRRSVYTFKAVCHPGDNGEPVITISFPHED